MSCPPPVESFAHKARQYCAFIEAADRYSVRGRLRTAALLLAELYAAALRLPDAERPSGPSPEVQRPASWPGFGPLDSYWKVADPHDLDEPLAGSLTDDLLDVYEDVRAGLDLFDQDDSQAVLDAACRWRLGLEHRWGHRAVDALRVLQRFIYQTSDTH